jgi:hypothetical protein
MVMVTTTAARRCDKLLVVDVNFMRTSGRVLHDVTTKCQYRRFSVLSGFILLRGNDDVYNSVCVVLRWFVMGTPRVKIFGFFPRSKCVACSREVYLLLFFCSHFFTRGFDERIRRMQLVGARMNILSRMKPATNEVVCS